MDTAELIARAEVEVERLQNRSIAVRKLMTATDKDLMRAQSELATLRRMVERHADDRDLVEEDVNSVDLVVESAQPEWAGLNRLQAVTRALAELRRPASLAEIEEYLERQGRVSDRVSLISAALNSLKKAKTVEQVRRGVWQIKQMEPTVHAHRLPDVYVSSADTARVVEFKNTIADVLPRESE